MNLRRKNKRLGQDIPAKANRVLNIILVGMLLIVLRIWHLTAIQHEERVEEALKPQKKIVIEPAKRGTIRDRFNIPLAINKIQYNAAILYSQIRDVPSIAWVKEDGKKVRKYKRREYIEKLSQLLAKELDLDPERVEDQIHAKASLYNNIPFVIKEDISEREYYRLKMLEKDWVGVLAACVSKRFYPKGKVAADIIGYMGAISKNEYEDVVQEIKLLENFLQNYQDGDDENLMGEISTIEEAKERLKTLTDRAYTMNDYVGKMGIEGQFEKILRGYLGKKSFDSDARGNFLRELPGSKEPLSGKRILLTISADLQEFAEKILIEHEQKRSIRVSKLTGNEQKIVEKKHPWIKGGSIIAMDPNNGDIIAMATNPRFDPNDFISSSNLELKKQKNENICRWFELDFYAAKVWDGKQSLKREVYDRENDIVIEEKIYLSLDKYLEFILPLTSPVKRGFTKIATIKNAYALQVLVDRLIDLTDAIDIYPLFNLIYNEKAHIPHGLALPAIKQEALEEIVENNYDEIQIIKRQLAPFFQNINKNYDKVLLVDLCRTLVNPKLFSGELLGLVGDQSLFQHRETEQLFVDLNDKVHLIAKDIFHELHFKPWRFQNQKEFIKSKRLEEKIAKIKYAKPYLDYIDDEEKKMFSAYNEENRFNFMRALITGEYDENFEDILIFLNMFEQDEAIKLRKKFANLSKEMIVPYLKSFRSFNDLTRPLLCRYRELKREGNLQQEKHLAAGFYPKYGFGFARSFAYRQSATPGSIFKVVTAYEALTQKYCKSGKFDLNPLEIVDDYHTANGVNYVGYTLDGKPIPQTYKGGRIPKSHRSGIGKVDIIKAMEFSSNPYFSLLAADHLSDPTDLAKAASNFCYGKKTGIDLPFEIAGSIPRDLKYNPNGLYSMAIGQHTLVVTPLQTAVMLSAIANGGSILTPKIVHMIAGKEEVQGEVQNSVIVFPTKIKNEIFMQKQVQNILLQGMFRVQSRTYYGAMDVLAEMYKSDPKAMSGFKALKNLIVGKSSTAESVENIDLDLDLGTNIYNHIWFGGIVFEKRKENNESIFVFNNNLGKPELVVVVYLRFGAWGKDAAPIAYQIAKKWRDIKKRSFL